MAIKKTSKEKILQKALYLFRVHGYHNTSLQVIAEACGLLKGSIYHYFPGKEEIGKAALEYILDEFRHSIFKIAHDQDLSPNTRLHRYSDAVEKYFINREGGCMMGNFSLEVIDDIPEFREIIRRYFDEWIHAVELILKDSGQYSHQETRKMAEDWVGRTQGTIMMYRIFKEKKILKNLTEETKNLI